MNPAHPDHDELLIVRVASGDADAVDASLAERQLAACPDCRTLLSDVSAIRASTVADGLRVPPRPRSFRILPEELERLRAPAWRRWLSGLGMPRFDLVRPLGSAVAGVGLAVVVLGSAVPSASPAAFLQASPGAATDAGAPGAPTMSGAQGGVKAPYGSPEVDNAGELGAASTATPAKAPPRQALEGQRELTQGQAPVPLASLGLVLLGSGLAIVVLNTAARRAAGR